MKELDIFSLVPWFFVLAACAPASSREPPPNSAAGAASTTPSEPEHGQLSDLSRVEGEIVLCEHDVPEKTCTRHHPELIAEFKRAGDWCNPHAVPESQCFECHPDLTFEPLPKLQPDADVKWLSRSGEDVPALETHAVHGKVTLFEFYADWCAACRKVDGHVYRRIANGDNLLAYRKLNLVHWESPLALRYVQDVPSLPYLVIFDTRGKRFKALHGAELDALDDALAAASQR